jgi:hypothetical protein
LNLEHRWRIWVYWNIPASLSTLYLLSSSTLLSFGLSQEAGTTSQLTPYFKEWWLCKVANCSCRSLRSQSLLFKVLCFSINN